jgi:flagellar biosynthesis/type III secretory pathway protein FliH
MAKNPVIKKAREDGYNAGFNAGVKTGFDQGKYSACMFFADKFDGLDKVPGIGPKMMKKIVEHFGKEYFEEANE